MRSKGHAARWGAALAVAIVGAGMLSGASAQAVSGATPVADGTYAFTAKVENDLRACTGTLVDPLWVLTATTCLADDPQTVPAGAPPRPTTVTVGRTDLSSTGGHRLAVISVVPHPTRNVVLMRLEKSATGVAPVAIGAAPVADEQLTAAGYGRTATEWVPNRLHAGDVTVRGVGAGTVELDGTASGATLCRGDAGGPALRTVAGVATLVGVHDRSWQGGCLGETETRRTATATRVDDLGDWILASKATIPLVIGLRARANSLYVTMGGRLTTPLIASRTEIGSWEKFDRIDVGGGYIALYSRTVNRYVTAPINGGVAPLIANASALGAWETFKLVRNSDGTTSLLANANNKYVSADNGGANPLIANRAEVGPWEKFDVVGSGY
ncbi:trypsin-like serine protease [Micromonospora sp. NPDC018662]|uniref:trypsin-like serine protease n=1 Tax=Micromonospora sp. NPDC018662 TaxID=3364238 RepID=UPI0037AB73FD